jgi:hypothetical protein
MYDLLFDVLVELKKITEELRKLNQKIDGGK